MPTLALPNKKLKKVSAPLILFNKPESVAQATSLTLPSTWEELENEVKHCKVCNFGGSSLLGRGVSHPLVLVVTDKLAPDDDGPLPFNGASGQFLSLMLSKIGLNVDTNCYITSLVKCYTPVALSRQSLTSCARHLEAQIALLKPQSILACGPMVARYFSATQSPLSELERQFYNYKGIKVLITYSPESVQQDESLKRPVWEALKKLLAEHHHILAPLSHK
jgi:DNA polymerase